MATSPEQPKKTEPQWNRIFACSAEEAWNAYTFLMRDLGYTESTIKLKSPTFLRLLERCFPDFNKKQKKEKPAKPAKESKKETKKPAKK